MNSKYKNLGKRSEAMLAIAGISTLNELRAKGSAAAYLAVKRAGCSPSLNLLWAIEGALSDRHWAEVAQNDRISLLMQLERVEKEPY